MLFGEALPQGIALLLQGHQLFLGIHDLLGGFGPWLLVPVGACLSVPDNVPDSAAVLVEPFAAADAAKKVAFDEAIRPILAATYGEAAKEWWVNWRLFFLACAETFAYDGGREWGVSHYRFVPR